MQTNAPDGKLSGALFRLSGRHAGEGAEPASDWDEAAQAASGNWLGSRISW